MNGILSLLQSLSPCTQEEVVVDSWVYQVSDFDTWFASCLLTVNHDHDLCLTKCLLLLKTVKRITGPEVTVHSVNTFNQMLIILQR